MASFTLVSLVAPILMLQWLIPGGESQSSQMFIAKTEDFLGKDWTTYVEHTSPLDQYFKDVATFARTRRRCTRANEWLYMVNAVLHDSRYPWRWTASPLDLSDLVLWGFFNDQFIFFDEEVRPIITGHEELIKELEATSLYNIVLNGIPVYSAYIIFVNICFYILLPLVGNPLVRVGIFIAGCLWNQKHASFWRSLLVYLEVSRLAFVREGHPFTIDGHVLETQFLIPYLFREVTEEGTPVEVVDFQGTVTLWVEDDSDSQLETADIMEQLYKDGKPRMELINMYHGVRVNLRKQPEFRNENWIELEEARITGIERRMQIRLEREEELRAEQRRDTDSSESSEIVNPKPNRKKRLGRKGFKPPPKRITPKRNLNASSAAPRRKINKLLKK